MRIINICLAFGVWGLLLSGGALAGELGDFAATATCPAVKSIKSGDNPGKIKVIAGKSYPAITLNKKGGDFVQVKVEGANPPGRWVRLDCGNLVDGHDDGKDGGQGKLSTDNLFVLSWQPAFCELHQSQHKDECGSQTAGRFDATHFTLHGLWPQPNGTFYCGVSSVDKGNDKDSSGWHKLPEPPGLTNATRANLDKAMPGTASDLHRHEWIKHGTCFGVGADPYFRTALALQEQVNNSQLQKFMAANIGKKITVTDLAKAFEQTFGPGSAAAMTVSCDKDSNSKRNLVLEFQFKLKGKLADSTPLAGVLNTSDPEGSCSSGIIDPVGFQ